MANVDSRTVAGFGDEWSRFDQSGVSAAELDELFAQYFSIFPWSELPPGAVGADFGCGSGRWARLVAPRVGSLHLIDASGDALEVARRNLAGANHCSFHHATLNDAPLANESLDFGYSLGVLHHIPDTRSALAACVSKLKRGAPFLLYLYYRFDNRPFWYARLWQASEILRRQIAWAPPRIRNLASDVIATVVYWPLARSAKALGRIGVPVDAFPLSAYRDRSFYVMRNDALDRFGTQLEQRFTRVEIADMMASVGLENVEFSPRPPFWCAVGRKA